MSRAVYKRRRGYTTLAVIVVTILGLTAKYYRGPGQSFVNHWGPASVAYEVFFMLLAYIVVPRRGAITPVAVTVCLATITLEFLQLWHPFWLEALRSTFLGQMILGHHFSWLDLPAYPIGCMLGWLLLHALTSYSSRPHGA